MPEPKKYLKPIRGQSTQYDALEYLLQEVEELKALVAQLSKRMDERA